MSGPLVFDIGCHKGEDSDFYLRKGFTVVAVEANPVLCARLKQRFLNQIAERRFFLIEKAIAERTGEVTFFATWTLPFGEQSEKIGLGETPAGAPGPRR